MTMNAEVWASFGSWLRTIRPNVLPSESVVMKAMRNKLSEYLSSDEIEPALAKFIIEKIDFTRSEGLKLLG